MPGWHERTKVPIAEGRLQIVGVIQEQHADRCRLFAQWKGIPWPILQDAVNALGPRLVPIVIAMDESGVVRNVNPNQSEFNAFLSREPNVVEQTNSRPHALNRHQLYEQAILSVGDKASEMSPSQLGDALLMWGTDADLDEVIASYEQAVAMAPTGPSHFRLGVAFRRRYESVNRRPGDFANAIKHWQSALDLNPNQYIWRRRIQQYGPRMTKPYAFYNWVSQANAEILTRGQTPIAIRGELTRAELAEPARRTAIAADNRSEPDAANRIEHDTDANVRFQATVVPPRPSPGETVRIFVELEPNSTKQVHWTNDAGPVQLWIESPTNHDAVRVERSLWEIPSRESTETSDENRMIEFEAQIPKNPPTNSTQLTGYVLYYICEGESGTCLYRRQNVSINISIAK